jgi:hypothetical protein
LVLAFHGPDWCRSTPVFRIPGIAQLALQGQHCGHILNNADIARTLGVSEPTVRDWLRIAHDPFLRRHIPALSLLATHPVVGKSWEFAQHGCLLADESPAATWSQ